MSRELYRGTFNYQGEVHTIYRHTPKTASWFQITKVLAKELGISHYSIRQFFSGNKDNFTIEKIK